MEDIRNKLVLVKVNHTTNPDWYHYEKKCVLQKNTNGKWEDIQKFHCVVDENGIESQISEKEYIERLKKLK